MYVKKFSSSCQLLENVHTKENLFLFFWLTVFYEFICYVLTCEVARVQRDVCVS